MKQMVKNGAAVGANGYASAFYYGRTTKVEQLNNFRSM
jgi:hypothetical protein